MIRPDLDGERDGARGMGEPNEAIPALGLQLIDNLLARPDFMRYRVGDSYNFV